MSRREKLPQCEARVTRRLLAGGEEVGFCSLGARFMINRSGRPSFVCGRHIDVADRVLQGRHRLEPRHVPKLEAILVDLDRRLEAGDPTAAAAMRIARAEHRRLTGDVS